MIDAIEHAKEAIKIEDGYIMNGISCDLCGRVYESVYDAELCENECLRRDDWRGETL